MSFISIKSNKCPKGYYSLSKQGRKQRSNDCGGRGGGPSAGGRPGKEVLKKRRRKKAQGRISEGRKRILAGIKTFVIIKRSL